MFVRPYTAVLSQGNSVRLVDVNAPPSRMAALKAVSDEFPKEKLLALIPGLHSSHSFAYYTENESTDRFLDPFDTTHVTEKS